ncbi:HSF-type DNA-binding domain-containing protein [Neurospora intermedia]|uniref:HSF-type DNA-binding domain-containing protein n=1 Tax=Neurospora intermedia TaxID=5142 RepID=A0ABR3DEG0_NEUIN
MATATESAPRNHLADKPENSMGGRNLSIITPTIQMSAPPDDPMDITSGNSSSSSSNSNSNSINNNATMSAPSNSDSLPPPKSPVEDTLNAQAAPNGRPQLSSANDQLSPDNIIMPAPAAAAPAVHQPKIVQTAFIHKLYNMLEDKSIQHLISWSPTSESFVMQPSQEFSKVLAQYFKHTNISSFVRQLNMYGFHKVSDVFHHGAPDATIWEFKHGNGNFKRGDLVSLREIKRRASRHSLVHREYSNNQKAPPSQPGTPAEPMPPMQEVQGGDPRLNNIEHTLYDLSTRLQRHEENAQFMHIKHQAIMDTVSRLLQFNHDLSRAVLALAPSPDNPIHHDVSSLQGQVQRQMEEFRSLDEPHGSVFASTRPYFSNVENAPVSPRQMPQDDPRRSGPTLTVPGQPPRLLTYNNYRPAVPSNLSISTPGRRPFGSTSGNSTGTSPSSLRPHPPPPPSHPLSSVDLHPGLARRHTSADIRAAGWQGNPPPPNPPPTFSGPPSSQWPSSPSRLGLSEDQRIRDSFSHYSLQSASHPRSRPASPPPPPTFSTNGGGDTFGNWSWNSAGRDNKNLSVRDHSAPPTRRGSMAHILNPTDTAERDDEDEDPRGDEDRKRKRLI